MTERHILQRDFLRTAGWDAATIAPLAGDASNRKYERLTLNGQPAVLMDAPPDKGENIAPFLRVATHLRALGLSAPACLAADQTNGFLLLEDLGDALFARVVAQDPTLETPLYTAAADVLLRLHDAPAPDWLTPYSPEPMATLATLPYDWYADENPNAAAAIQHEMTRLLTTQITADGVLVQRDYHSENLLWLPDRNGPARVGLLDFQDAMRGPAAYDLISLLEDARRDVSDATKQAVTQHYAQVSGMEIDALLQDIAICGAQRNLRIIGVFARLCLRDGKPHYLAHMPRVWRLLLGNLAHPSLDKLRKIVLETIPEPTPERLSVLHDCAGSGR